MQKTIAAKETEMQEAQKSLRKAVALAAQDGAKYRQDRIRMKESAAEIQTELDVAHEQLASTEEHAQSLRRRLRESEADLSQFGSRLKQRSDDVLKAMRARTESEIARGEISKELESAKAELAKATKRIEQLEGDWKAQQTANERLRSQLQNARNELQESVSDRMRLESQIHISQQERQLLENSS